MSNFGLKLKSKTKPTA